ncbi:hypothetical protein RIF29_30198 [Crotalaria pallida]|uniref:Uncharacterized protein n=1 Tax=Crotalaria pallida TaxID=3830 RepID=A0AAN9EL25_CROPI
MKANRNCPPHGEFQGYKEWFYDDPLETRPAFTPIESATEAHVESASATGYTPIESATEPQVEIASATAYTPIESSYVPSEAHAASESATIANNAKPEMPKVSKTKRGKRTRAVTGESSKASIDPKATDSEIHEPKSKRGSGTMMGTTEPMATDSAPRTYDQILNLLNEP